MKIRSCCCAGLSFVTLLALTTTVFADESGTVDFDTDPGFSILDLDIGDGAGAAPIVNVMTSMSVADITLNRDGSRERVFLPLTGSYLLNNNRVDMRIRFAVLPSTTSSDDLHIGAFNTGEQHTTAGGVPWGDSQTTVWLEGPGSNAGYRHIAGGEFLAPDVDSVSFDVETWYVYDFTFQPVPQISTWTLYEGDGSTLIYSVDPGSNTGGIGCLSGGFS